MTRKMSDKLTTQLCTNTQYADLDYSNLVKDCESVL